MTFSALNYGRGIRKIPKLPLGNSCFSVDLKKIPSVDVRRDVKKERDPQGA